MMRQAEMARQLAELRAQLLEAVDVVRRLERELKSPPRKVIPMPLPPPSPRPAA